MVDGHWSDLAAWDYTKLCAAYESTEGGRPSRLHCAKIRTEAEFAAALHLALTPEYQRKLVVLEVLLTSQDRSATLVGITSVMRADVKAAACTAAAAAAAATKLCAEIQAE